VAIALLWCDAWCRAVPGGEGARRSEEYRAFLADAVAAGVRGGHLGLGAVRGAADDVRWCNEARRAAGERPLAHELLAGRDASVLTVIVLMALAYVVSLFPAVSVMGWPLALAGTASVVGSMVRSMRQRVRSISGG
jgi:hypothetical protein